MPTVSIKLADETKRRLDTAVAAQGLKPHACARLVEFLLIEWPLAAAPTVDMLVDALGILAQHPKIGRPVAQGLREQVISRGKLGYLALYDYDQ